MTSNVISFPVRGQHRIKAIASRLRQLDLTDYDAPQEMRVMRACREKTWHEMIRAVLRGGPLSGEPPKFRRRPICVHQVATI